MLSTSSLYLETPQVVFQGDSGIVLKVILAFGRPRNNGQLGLGVDVSLVHKITLKAEERRTTEDETVGRHHRFHGHELGQAPGDGEGWGSLACCSPWAREE